MEFQEFPKIARLRREATITEKLDGTNSAIVIKDDGEILCQSRNRFITTDSDNFGFANWVDKNKNDLIDQLGPGCHFGEWWGSGIQRGYGLKEKRFSLFNVHRWHTESDDFRCIEAPLCFVVPTIAVLEKFSTDQVDGALESLKATGSLAVPGYMNPEGIVIFHSQNGALYKVTYEYDEKGKGQLDNTR